MLLLVAACGPGPAPIWPISSVRSSPRTWSTSRTPSTLTLVRSSSTICRAGTTPTSAVISTSSISSQVSSSSRSRDSRPSSTEPIDDWDRASRSRSRTSRPADGGGFSISGAGRRRGTGRRGRGDDVPGRLGRTLAGCAQLVLAGRLRRGDHLDAAAAPALGPDQQQPAPLEHEDDEDNRQDNDENYRFHDRSQSLRPLDRFVPGLRLSARRVGCRGDRLAGVTAIKLTPPSRQGSGGLRVAAERG